MYLDTEEGKSRSHSTSKPGNKHGPYKTSWLDEVFNLIKLSVAIAHNEL